MSLVLNIDASRSAVLKMCNRHEVRISAIETLDPPGTRVTLYNAQDADVLARAFAGKVIKGATARRRLA